MKIRDVLRKYTEDNKRYVSSKLSTADSSAVHNSGNETIGGTKTFSDGVVGNITGNVTGNVTGNADTATRFSSNASVALTGDVTGTASSKKGWSVAATVKNIPAAATFEITAEEIAAIIV